MSILDRMARTGYEAYIKSSVDLTWVGNTFPKWEDLSEDTRKYWGAAAKAISKASYKKGFATALDKVNKINVGSSHYIRPPFEEEGKN